MFRAVFQAPGDAHCFRRRSLATQVELPWSPNFPAYNEIRFLKILQFHVDDWVVQNLPVRGSKRISHFRQRLTLYTYAVHATKRDIAIGLDGHGLIEFRRERKAQLQNIGGVYLIAPVPMLQSCSLCMIASFVSLLADDPLRATCRRDRGALCLSPDASHAYQKKDETKTR